MADEQATEQPDADSPKAIGQPHDKYFQRVFSNERNAASLLRTCMPQPLADTLKWSTLSCRVASCRMTGRVAARVLQIEMMAAFRGSAEGVAAVGGLG